MRVTGAGTIDLGTKMMGFRVEPKLVMTTEGQGRTSDPVGFGIPVMIEGPWSRPRIYPEMQGILDNPDGAYAKLREMGKGLFGPNGGGLGGVLSALTGNSSGLRQQRNQRHRVARWAAISGRRSATCSSSPAVAAAGASQRQVNLNPSPSRTHRRRRRPSPPRLPAPPQQAQAQNDQPQDSQPMNDVLRQLFNR